MGLMNNLVSAAKNELENTKAKAAKQAECAKDRSLPIIMTFGYKELGIGTNSTLRQKIDGETYFNLDDSVLYKITGYEWEGPSYEIKTSSNSRGSENSETTKKGKSGKMAAGAIIGTVLFPGVGTVVGAAIGAGGKGKSKTQATNESSTEQIQKHVEKNNTAIIRLQRMNDGAIFSITIICNSNIDSQIRCYNIEKQASVSSTSKEMTDALKGVKALKELMDMGAITQEEFNAKKKQLLQ